MRETEEEVDLDSGVYIFGQDGTCKNLEPLWATRKWRKEPRAILVLVFLHRNYHHSLFYVYCSHLGLALDVAEQMP